MMSIEDTIKQMVLSFLEEKQSYPYVSQKAMADMLDLKERTLRDWCAEGRLLEGVHYDVVGYSKKGKMYVFYPKQFIARKVFSDVNHP